MAGTSDIVMIDSTGLIGPIRVGFSRLGLETKMFSPL